MKSTATVVPGTAFTTCAIRAGHRADDRFTDIAHSREGAAIENRSHVRGAPRILAPQNKTGGAGFATSSRMDDSNFLPANSTNQAIAGRASRCEATANVDAADIIERVAVASTRRGESRESLRQP